MIFFHIVEQRFIMTRYCVARIRLRVVWLPVIFCYCFTYSCTNGSNDGAFVIDEIRYVFFLFFCSKMNEICKNWFKYLGSELTNCFFVFEKCAASSLKNQIIIFILFKATVVIRLELRWLVCFSLSQFSVIVFDYSWYLQC